MTTFRMELNPFQEIKLGYKVKNKANVNLVLVK